MSLEKVIRAIQDGDGAGAVQELATELRQGTAAHLSTGEMSAHRAFVTFQIREGTAEAGGADIEGFPDTLEALAQEPPETAVQLVHFKSPEKYFTVFAVAGRVLGTIRVVRRESLSRS